VDWMGQKLFHPVESNAWRVPWSMHCLLLLALLFAGPTQALAVVDEADSNRSTGYLIAAGDTVSIKVFGEAELSPQVKVDESGNIDYPLLGVLPVSGLSTHQLADKIQQGLKGPYLVDPKVSVSVSDYRPFYIHGQVRSPGSYSFEPGMTVRKAVALAGGLSDHASTRKIFRLPEGGQNGIQRVKVGLEDAVLPGDTITVEESFF
jgi:protein involved in polysaccharide export with SLBB domain